MKPQDLKIEKLPQKAISAQLQIWYKRAQISQSNLEDHHYEVHYHPHHFEPCWSR